MQRALLELAHESADAESFERGVLGLARADVGCELAMWLPRTPEPIRSSLGFDPGSLTRMEAHGSDYAAEVMPLKELALAGDGVVIDTEVWGAQIETRYFRELAAPLGGRSTLLAYLRWRGAVVGGLMLGSTGRELSRSARDRVAEWLPTLSVARAALGLPLPSLVPLPHRTNRGRELARVRAPSGAIVVRDRAGFREMVHETRDGEFVWTREALDRAGESGWPYVDLLQQAALLTPACRRALHLGCGGGVALRQLRRHAPAASIDVVEVEPAVVELARTYFGLNELSGLQVHVADAARFVANAPADRWDVVMVDAFMGPRLGARFRADRFWASLRRILSPGGALAMNTIGTLDPGGDVARLARRAERHFTDVRLHPVMTGADAGQPSALRNVVIVAR